MKEVGCEGEIAPVKLFLLSECLFWKIRVLWLLGLISVDMTHSGSSVDLVPAAEDEAGLGVIHPEDRQTDEQKKDRRTDRQVHRLVIVERPKLWREARQRWVLLPCDIGWKGLQPYENNLILERSHNTTWGAGSSHSWQKTHVLWREL